MIDETLAGLARRPGIERRQVLYREPHGRWRLGLLVDEDGTAAVVARPTVAVGFDAEALGPGANRYGADLTAVPRLAVVPFDPPAPELSDLVRASIEAAGEHVQETVAQRLDEGVAYVETLPFSAEELEPLLRRRGNTVTTLPSSFELAGEGRRTPATATR